MSQERNVKPRSKGLINATGVALAPRHVGRIQTLRGAIEKAKKRIAEATEAGDSDTLKRYEGRVESLQEELDRRLEELKAIRAELEAL